MPVHDERLDAVAKTIGASNIVPDTIEFHDIAGLVAGAHQGEGLGNKFLANIRETDALLHVVRTHHDENVIHPDGPRRPGGRHRDDRDRAALRRPRLGRAPARAGRPRRPLRRPGGGGRGGVAAAGDRGAAVRPARALGAVPHDAPDAARNLSPLTGKPVLFVANVDEGDDAVPSAVADHAAATGAAAVAISCRVEAELSELDDEEATMMREELGVGESGLNRVVRGAFGLLDLIAFFTAGEAKPAQSWHLRNGLSAWHAAGEIHTDIQKGFVRAEVIGWDALVEAGGYAGARDRGTLRLEGRDYLMSDGDVITVKFTP